MLCFSKWLWSMIWMVINPVLCWTNLCSPIIVLLSIEVQMLSWRFFYCKTISMKHSCHLIRRDEEYDRGRTKKVRKSKRDFSGPNPFQEMENIRSRQRRRLRTDQARSGHEPLRIWHVVEAFRCCVHQFRNGFSSLYVFQDFWCVI